MAARTEGQAPRDFRDRPRLVVSDLAGEEDLIPPDAITDLAGSDQGDGAILLTWTATGDDGSTGTASQYDLRYTTYAQGQISEANWDTIATHVPGLPLPQIAGTAEQFVVRGLPGEQGYYLATKAIDNKSNVSGISNVADVWLEQATRVVVLEPIKDSGMYGLVASGNSNRGAGGRFDVRADDPTEVNSVLMQFDLSGVLSPGEHIESATLELFSVREEAGLTWDLEMKAYPLLDLWVEGIGTTDGIGGSTDYPWGPASVGDAVYSYKQVSTVAPDPGFGNYDVATGGVAWTVGGARGVGTDVSSELIIDQDTTGTGYAVGTSLCVLDFTAAGVTVLNEWAIGTRNNYGFSLFPGAGGVGYWGVGTKEYSNSSCHPKLTLSIVPD